MEPIGAERIDEFLDLARTLRGGDPEWVPPLASVQARDLCGRGEFGRYGRVQPFVAWGPEGAVGRIAAAINPRLAGDDGRPIGQVGWFESVDESAVARALIESAERWLAGHGARTIWGPIEGGAHRAHRFLVSGFERAPFLFEPRNPTAHPRLFEACGFRSRHRWSTYEFSAEDLAARFAAERLTAAGLARARRRFRIECPDPHDPAAALARIHPLLDRAWGGHVGYAPFDLAEFAEAFGGLVALLDPGHLLVAVSTSGGQDVGFGFVYPDYVEEVRALDGDASGWATWIARPERPRRLVLHTVAVLPEARRSGAALLLIEEGIRLVAAGGHAEAVVALVTEDLKFFSRLARPTREYALHERPIR